MEEHHIRIAVAFDIDTQLEHQRGDRADENLGEDSWKVSL